MLTFEGRTGPDRDVDYPDVAVPPWWRDARRGLFVHWGIYSVPAFACPPGSRADDHDAYARHTYAEWYANTVRIPGSPTALLHAERYGERTYEDLLQDWRAEEFDADALARDAVAWGFSHVVLTAKHHDGCCLWDTATTDFSTARRGPRRDLVAEVVAACRRHGLRVGLYFSGALDWHVSDFGPITDDEELFAFRRNDADFARYQAAQLDELVERFAPRPAVERHRLARRRQGPGALRRRRTLASLAGPGAPRRDERPLGRARARVPDPRVRTPGRRPGGSWEATRGIGHSFGATTRSGPRTSCRPRRWSSGTTTSWPTAATSCSTSA